MLAESRFHEIKATGELPSPTGTALRLLELTQRDDSAMAEIARLLQTDPALSGRLIRFVNSPYLGRRRPVAAIPEAILLVGLHVVRQIVLGLSVLSNYRNGRCRAFDYRRFWAHSLATGVAAEALCAREPGYPPEEAFTCGLLAGVGRLALATVYPVEYSEILNQAAGSDPQALLNLEQERLLTTHVDLAAAMLQDWGLPRVHLDAVRGLYDRNAVQSDNVRAHKLAACLNFARRLADVCIGEDRLRDVMIPKLVDDAAEFDFDEPTFTGFFDELNRHWREWAGVLEVKAKEVPPFSEMLQRARSEALKGAVGAPAEPGEALRILVVDDEPTTRELLKAQLSALGYAVATANDGRQGLHLAMEFQPHLIITDWLMPQMDGIRFCRTLRTTREGQRIYVIMLTAQESESCLVEAFEAGADDYIVKPIIPRVLQARLRGGERLVRLQREVERESDENRQYLAELALANRRLEQAALTDVLTNLPNRRHALRRLEQVWSAASRADAAVTLMLLDVDYFKQINDTYGHAHGDRILTEVAAVLRSAARTDDEVCRFGGEEFMVICSTGEPQAAVAAAERLRGAIERHQPGLHGITDRLTISGGVAVIKARQTDPDRLMRIADQALYHAKRLGRNRVCLVTDPNGTVTRAPFAGPVAG